VYGVVFDKLQQLHHLLCAKCKQEGCFILATKSYEPNVYMWN